MHRRICDDTILHSLKSESINCSDCEKLAEIWRVKINVKIDLSLINKWWIWDGIEMKFVKQVSIFQKAEFLGGAKQASS